MNPTHMNNLKALSDIHGADAVVAALAQIEEAKADAAKREGYVLVAARLSAAADALNACSAELETYIQRPDFRAFS